MSKKFTFYGKVKDGKISCRNQIMAAIKMLDGDNARFIIEKFNKRRSTNQNSYWFAMIQKYLLPHFWEWGNDCDPYDIHEHTMTELGYVTYMTLADGSFKPKRMSSSEFSTIQWEEFMDRARAMYAQEPYKIMIPLPNEHIDPETGEVVSE